MCETADSNSEALMPGIVGGLRPKTRMSPNRPAPLYVLYRPADQKSIALSPAAGSLAFLKRLKGYLGGHQPPTYPLRSSACHFNPQAPQQAAKDG